MRALVTGGAGFIGSEMVRQLTHEDHEVIVIDNLVNGKFENLNASKSSNLNFNECDVRDTDRVKTLMNGVDVVFHLACLGVRHSIHSPFENHEVNATATLKLLELARASKVKRFVCVSTSEVYGTAKNVPMTESHPTLPHTVYGASKLAGENYARAFYKTYGYETVIVRPFNSYGPRSHHEGDSGEVIPKFILKALTGRPLTIFGDGHQTRDFTYVSDTARGIILAGVLPVEGGSLFNLGFGSEVKVLELAQQVLKVVKNKTGKASSTIVNEKPRPGDVLRLYADSTLAKKTLGFRTETELTDGLAKLVDWYLSLPVDANELLKDEKNENWKIN